MSILLSEALDMVPRKARNREKLARLLIAVEAERERIENERGVSHWHQRIERIATLMVFAGAEKWGSREANAAYKRLNRAIEAARKYASRHGITQGSAKHIREAAQRLIEAA